MAYEWDIFLSYPRAGQVGRWVHNHFLPVLQDGLDVVLAHRARIFVDQAQPTGVEWPEHIKTALLRSRLMVAVWTPPYFRSDWCIAEWLSMREREREMESQGQKPQRGLVYPVVYSDGKHFDPRAKATLYQTNLSAFTYPYPGFRESAAYLQFHDAISVIAREIEDHLETIPDWRADWPIVAMPPTLNSPVGLARL